MAVLAAASTSACSTHRVPPPKLLWSDEFTTLDLLTPQEPMRRWRANDVWQAIDKGYADFGSGGQSTWCANPVQKLNGVEVDPFRVSNSVLSIQARRTPPDLLNAVRGCPWIGGMLISNTQRNDMTFEYGYYEFRARLPNPGKGMFPAIWFFAARDQNPGREGAEIDLLEVFGDGRGAPWLSSLHRGGTNNGFPVQTVQDATTDWHLYGLDWTVNSLTFYRDRKQIAEIAGEWAQFFAGCKMSIRLDYVMDAQFFDSEHRSDSSTPDVLTFEIDYVRKYDRPF